MVKFPLSLVLVYVIILLFPKKKKPMMSFVLFLRLSYINIKITNKFTKPSCCISMWVLGLTPYLLYVFTSTTLPFPNSYADNISKSSFGFNTL